MYAHPSWTVLPDPARYGQALRAASVMLGASQSLHGTVDAATGRVCKSIVDTMLRVAWDREKAGFHLAGSSFGGGYIDGIPVLLRSKRWWVQADGLRALLVMARLYPDDDVDYMAYAERLWGYVKENLVDAKHGGWFVAGLDGNPEARKQPKATAWKDASHETEALVDSIAILDSL
jgi:mannobiose 2-epimerase